MLSRFPRYLPLLAFLACTASEPEPDPDLAPAAGAPSATVDPSAGSASDTAAAPDAEELATAGWTAGIVDEARQVTGAALLTDVRVAENEGFDRVVLEFEGDEMPSYHIEYIDRPIRQCGSGNTVQIPGDGWLSIRLEPANAHTEEGQATITNRTLQPSLTVVREIHIVCDFEAQVEWVLGVAAPNPFRVMELADPTRLVVDVRH